MPGDETAFAILKKFQDLFAERGLVDIGPLENMTHPVGLPHMVQKNGVL
jgi:hypothetical protein